MRFLDILMLMGVVGVLYWLTRKGRKRPLQTEETAFTLLDKTDITSSPLFDFPHAAAEATPHFLVLDTETADLIGSSEALFSPESGEVTLVSPPIPPIVRLAWSLLDAEGNVIREESYTLCQETSITMAAEELHGLSTEEMHRLGRPPQEVYRILLEDITPNVVLVGHNLDFHLSALTQDMQCHGVSAPEWNVWKRYCLMEQGTDYWEQQHPHEVVTNLSLVDLYGLLYFGRRHLSICYGDKSRRDILLAIACIRFLLKEDL